jgi:putative DNA primase/helicase
MPRDLATAARSAVVHTIWPEPQPIGSGLPDVMAFDLALLPQVLRDFAGDVAERMQTPADFLGVTLMVAAGSLIGTKVGIRPQTWTDWHEVPNPWGLIIGRPGVMKSPTMKAAMRPVFAIEADARRDFEFAMSKYQAGSAEREVRAAACKAAMRERLKEDAGASVSDLAFAPDEEPTCTRYVVNDSSYQSLGMLLTQNPNGLLVHRDEMVALLKSLDGEANAEARGFYLQAWNGGDGYTFDRVGRGLNQHIPSVTLSLIGSTQPGKIREYVSAAVGQGSSDDGLIQRFGLLVWPDMPTDWREHDRQPDARAMAEVTRAYARLAALSVDAIGAQVNEGDEKRPYLRFDPDGRAEFQDWHSALERRLRSSELHPAVESHLAKYRKLIPVLALIHHLVGGGTGPVGAASVMSALAWGEYLESHALRLYGAATCAAVEGARTIAKRISKGDLGSTFDPRTVQRRGWSGLSDAKAVADALEVLEEHQWISIREEPSGPRGGRPTVLCTVNPRALS